MKLKCSRCAYEIDTNEITVLVGENSADFLMSLHYKSAHPEEKSATGNNEEKP